jgi:trehalose 6-phosphate synthase
MRAMRRQIAQHDVKAWADSFMTELEDEGHSHTKTVRPATRS